MFEQYTTLVSKFQSEAALYASKPTKASSKRLRDLINQMKKIATPAKAELLSRDKGE